VNGHIATLYLLFFIALSIAMGAAFGQRSDYLRLNDLGAPQLGFWELFR
jgi:hypothetical protein